MNSQPKHFLRKLIGSRARHQDEVYEIIEVLEDGPALVLQDISHTTIQADQHGEAHRRVPQTLTLKLPLTESGDIDVSAIDLDLLDIKISDLSPTEKQD